MPGVRRVVRAICEAFTPRLRGAETLLSACLCQGNYLLSCTEPRKVTALPARVGLRFLPSAPSPQQTHRAVSSPLTLSLPSAAEASCCLLSRRHPLDVFARPAAARCKQELGSTVAVVEEGVWVVGAGRWGALLLCHPVSACACGRGLL